VSKVQAQAQAIESEFSFFGDALATGAGSREAEEVQRRGGPRMGLRDVAIAKRTLNSAGKPVDVSDLLGSYA
jgi:hypothetical protein